MIPCTFALSSRVRCFGRTVPPSRVTMHDWGERQRKTHWKRPTHLSACLRWQGNIRMKETMSGLLSCPITDQISKRVNMYEGVFCCLPPQTCGKCRHYSGFRSIVWTCIQRIRNMRLILSFSSSLRHTASLLFTVSSVGCKPLNKPTALYNNSLQRLE